MINNISMKKKINVLKGLIYLGFIIVVGRLFVLQIINRDYYLELLNNKTTKIIAIDTTIRGKIYDTNGHLLVDNQLVMNIIYKNINNLNTKEEINLAYSISNYLELDYSKLTISYLKDFYILMNNDLVNERLTLEEYTMYQNREITFNEFYKLKKDKVTNDDLNIYTDNDRKAIYLYYLMTNGYSYMDKIIKEDCSIKEFMFFSENNSNLNGFDTMYTYGRIYLYDDTFRTILGSVGNIQKENKDYYLARGYSLNDKVGLTNIEFVYDDILQGEKEIYKVIDGEKILLKEGKRGSDLYLTIDINLQKYVDNLLSDEVRRAKNSYNSQYYNHSYVLISDTLGNILTVSGKQIINGQIYDNSLGNITDTIIAGSAVKGASMLVGYDTKTIKMGEVMYDECLKIKSTPKKCSVYQMGNVNDITALAQSSNVYQFKIAIKLGGGIYRYNQSLKVKDEAFDIYRDYFSRFGLGVNTGIELINESRGYKGSMRNAGLLMDFAIGQYDTYTTIQLNQYISTIAQNGKRYKMHLLKEVRDSTTNEVMERIEPVILNELNIEQKYLNRVKQGLRAVMEYGTGKNYANYNLNVSGKTGTSESFIDTDGDGKIDTETTSTSFVMYMPSDNPKVAIAITSPHIGNGGRYKYPINQNVIKNLTNNYYQIVS